MTGKGFPGGTGTGGGANETSPHGSAGTNASTTEGNGTDATGSTLVPVLTPDVATLSCSGYTSGGLGGAGTFSYNSHSYGSTPTASTNNTQDFSTKHIDLGHGGTGGQGGLGALAGGNGGGGGAGFTVGVNSPTTGGPAGSGNAGAGGQGGTGAGFIYVNAWNIDLNNSSTTIFIADGGTGSVGGNGSGTGGYGGNGGDGGSGDCGNGTTFYPAGAPGTAGIAGDGADGGNGGDGGKANAAWVTFGSSGTLKLNGSTITDLSSVVEFSGGTGGSGGTGSAYGTLGADGNYGTHINVCSCSTLCAPTYGTVTKSQTKYCDCDDAFRVLSACDGRTGSLPGAISYTTTGSSSSAQWDGSTLSATESVTTQSASCYGPQIIVNYTYLCPLHDETGGGFFTATAGSVGSTGGGSSGWGGGPNYSNGYYAAHSGILYTDAVNLDISNAMFISNGCFTPTGIYNAGHLIPRNGLSGKQGKTGTSTNTTGFPVHTAPETDISGTPSRPEIIVDQNTITNQSLHIMPNPANDHIDVYFNSNSAEANILIYDMSGKEISRTKIGTITGQNKQTVSLISLMPGTYTISIEHDNKVDRANFIKQ